VTEPMSDPKEGRPKWGFATLAVHGSGGVDPATGAVSKPIYQSSTFAFKSAESGARIFAGEEDGYVYTRISNPTTRALEQELAALEGAEAAVAFASGMAATSAVVLALCASGRNLVLCEPVYGGTHKLALDILPRLGIESRLVDGLDLPRLSRAIDDQTGLVWIETPANPTLKVLDIAAVAAVTRKAGVPLVVDNTFATPYYQQPLALGASIVVHSATKYISGHGDTVAGLVVCDRERADRIRNDTLRDIGGVISPFNAWLLLRGLKTLPVRMDRHSFNAMRVAQYLTFHPKVERVLYPGLRTHPQHEIAARQMKGFGGMVTFFVKGGREEGARFLNSLELCTLAVSLGDCDTLIEHPASMTHSTYSEEELAQFSITPNLIRISVGIEDVEDIITDLRQGLENV
jgi:methionine-gamma-lyase